VAEGSWRGACHRRVLGRGWVKRGGSQVTDSGGSVAGRVGAGAGRVFVGLCLGLTAGDGGMGVGGRASVAARHRGARRDGGESGRRLVRRYEMKALVGCGPTVRRE